MRGSPLLRALLTFLVLLALAPLLWQMTRPASPVAANPAHETPVASSRVRLEFAFTAIPEKLAVKHLGREVWAKTSPESREECELDIPWPKEGGELLFKVEWPADAPLAAMRVMLTDPGQNEIERTVWGRGPTEKVLGFP